MKKNPAWSALLIGIFVTTLIIVIAVYLFEKIVPFSRDIKGVENGDVSYYRANTALNEALLSMSGANPGYETGSSSVTNGSGISYQVIALATTLPQPGKWDSEYDTDWAMLAPGKPVQLVLSTGINWSAASFNFRVPNLDKNTGTDESLSGWVTMPIVNWSLSASGDTLQASGSQIMANGINGTSTILDTRAGLTVSGSTSSSLSSFYASNCGTPNACTLKLSLINPLILQDGVTIAPYLEYQAHFNVPVPLQTAVVETQGYVGGFRKNITRFVQQTTTNEALDFTVFQ